MPPTPVPTARNPRQRVQAATRLRMMLGMVFTTALGIAGGCSGSDGPTARQAPPQVGAIGVNIFPGSMTLAPGDSSSAGITVTRGGQFSDPVTLTATGAPAGVTVSLRPATVTIAQSSSVNVAVAAGTAPGTFEITIIGRSGTIVSQPETLTLRIR